MPRHRTSPPPAPVPAGQPRAGEAAGAISQGARRRAALVVGLLLAPLVVLLPRAAVAETPVPVLRWQLSQQFHDHLSDHVLRDGATEDLAGVVTFPDGVGTYDRATGAGEIAYRGSVSGSFQFAGTTFYTVTVADPVVSVDAEGHGRITAMVSASNISSGSIPAESTSPLRVTVVEFDATSWVRGSGELGTQSATPYWDGVLPAGSERARDMGIPADQPVGGRAWHPDFLDQITGGVRAHFYSSGSSSDPKKAPATFSAQGVGTGEGSQPQPEPVDGLRWQVSSAFDQVAAEHAWGGGATEDDAGVITFPRSSGTYDTVTGEARATYVGQVRATATEPAVALPTLPFPLPLPLPDREVFTVTIADPEVITGLTGHGSVTAVVSSSNPLGPDALPGRTTAERVELVSFEAGEDPWRDATDLGSLPVTPSAFSRSLLAQLVAPARAAFDQQGETGAAEAPAELVAAAEPAVTSTPAVSVSTVRADPDGLVLDVAGSGFRGVSRAGDTGLSVGLGAVGPLPDVATPAGRDSFAAVVDVPAAGVVDGAFVARLEVPVEALEATTSYAVHTWQAPRRSNPSQDTQTSVALDLVALGLIEDADPQVRVTPGAASPEGGQVLEVTGTGFRAVTNPGDAGVYVGLAESGGLPDVSVFDVEKFVIADWIMPGSMPDGSWSSRLTAATARLDPAKRYSVYTWQAHTHSNLSQDSETPVTIDFVALGLAAEPDPDLVSVEPVVTGRLRATYGAGRRLAVVLPDDATGTVRLTGAGAARTAPVADGVASLQVPRRLGAGRHRLTFTYSGDATYRPATTAAELRVRRATPRLRHDWRPSSSAGRLRLTVRVVGPDGVGAPSGLVGLLARSGRREHRLVGRLDHGRVTLALPRLREGRWRFTVAYPGTENLRAVRDRFARRVG